jgi:hypothetical protein
MISEDFRINGSGGAGHRVLYHRTCDTRGCKRRNGNASQGYLVLYHRETTARHQDNQLQARLYRGYLVLYHLRLGLIPFLAPLFDVWVTTTEVTRFLLCQPRLLRSMLTSLFAIVTKTCSLTIAYTGIRNKESAAELTMFGQLSPPELKNPEISDSRLSGNNMNCGGNRLKDRSEKKG